MSNNLQENGRNAVKDYSFNTIVWVYLKYDTGKKQVTDACRRTALVQRERQTVLRRSSRDSKTKKQENLDYHKKTG